MNTIRNDHNGLFVAHTGEGITLAALAALLGMAASGIQIFNGLDNKNNKNTEQLHRQYSLLKATTQIQPSDARLQQTRFDKRKYYPVNRLSPSLERQQRKKVGPW